MPEELAQFVILAKDQKGRALEALIHQVLSNRKIFVFGELLELPSVQCLVDTEYAKTFRTLELFAYGVYTDYVQNRDAFIDLNGAQLQKLKQLSLVSYAQSSRILQYAALMSGLGVQSNRELEELIVETIYTGIIKGRLDQRAALFRVKDYHPRDVPPQQWDTLRGALTAFQRKTEELLGIFQHSSMQMAAQRDDESSEAMQLQDVVNKLKAQITGAMDLGSPAGTHKTGRGNKSARMVPG